MFLRSWILALLGLACGCRAGAHEEPFDPDYFKQHQHIAIVLHLDRGALTLSQQPATLRPGPAPYQGMPRPVQVMSLEASGAELHRWQIGDPRGVEPDGPIELLLPADAGIAAIRLIMPDGPTLTFDVADKIRALLPR